jgi:hypothetical protein
MSSLQSQTGVHKKALLIGVGKYPAEGGWNGLNSANDLGLIKDALLSQGFTPDNICIVSDEQATKENIISTIKTKLIKEVKKGDIAFFHFSGHGQQMEDKDGDEIDGYDECLVPFDSPKKYVPGVYEGQKLITDDELRKIFEDLRRQLGTTGHLIVSLDACHSGTGTRGASLGRGTTEPMASTNYIQNNIKKKILKENNQINTSISSAALAPMVAFFGSAQNQINYEMTDDQGKQFGSLSYALSKFLVLAKKDESYRGLFDKIKVEMSAIAPSQQPQAEGDLDIEVLNGKALGATSYYKVISPADDDNIIINGGMLQGLNVGSVVGFYNPDTRDIENIKPIVKGKVTKSMNTSATITLDSAVASELLKDTWVYVLEQSMGDIKVGVNLIISDHVVLDKVQTKLFNYSFIINDPKSPNLIIEEKKNSLGKSYLYMTTHDGYPFDSFPVVAENQNYLYKLSKAVITYLKGQSLRKMVMENEDLQLSFKIIPLSLNAEVTNVDSLIPLKADATGTMQAKVGEIFQVLIENNGNKPAYFNLIDLQPDNRCNFMLPAKDQSPEEMKVLPGMKKLMPNQWTVGEPLGNELFKLISSSKSLDLSSAYGTRGSGEKNPFEKLFNQLENVEFLGTRGSKPVPVSNMDINIFSESFIIVK